MEIKEILELWLDSTFLEKFKKVGEYYLNKIEEEKNGKQCICRAEQSKRK